MKLVAATVVVFALAVSLVTIGCGGGLGSCTIYCSGVASGGNPWSNTFGPYEDYTEKECKDEARNSENNPGECSANWEAY